MARMHTDNEEWSHVQMPNMRGATGDAGLWILGGMYVELDWRSVSQI